MGILRALIFLSVVYFVVNDDKMGPIGPSHTSQQSNNTSTSTTLHTNSTSTSTTTTPTNSTSTTSTSTNSTTSTMTPTSTTNTTRASTTSTTTTPKSTTTSTTTTPKSTTSTSKPTPTTPAPPPNNGTWTLNYDKSDRICLVLKAEFKVDIPYKDGNVTKQFEVKIPPTAKANGTCRSDVEKITLSFDNSNAINFVFTANNSKYDLESIVAQLNVTLPGRNDSSVFVLAHDKSEFSTPLSFSYKCTKEEVLDLAAILKNSSTSAKLRISDFQVQAFRNATSSKFDEALDCASSETPDAVPIAVGCALAALVIIVLVAYLIGRRRSQARGYLSMFTQNKREEDYIPMKNLSCFN